MEIFKKALKQAILEKNEAVRFEVGQYPILITTPNEKPLTNLGIVDHPSMYELIESIIPPNPSSPSLVREGSISIVNFGEVKLLASTMDPLRLLAFIPPHGTLLYLQSKTQLSQLSQKVPPRPLNLADESTVPPQPAQFAQNQATDQKSDVLGTQTETRAEEPTVRPGSDDTSVHFKTAYMKSNIEPVSSPEENPVPAMVPASPPAMHPILIDEDETNNTLNKAVPSQPTTLFSPSYRTSSGPAETEVALNPGLSDDTETDNYHFSQITQIVAHEPQALVTGQDTPRNRHSLDTIVTPPKTTATIDFGSTPAGDRLEGTGPRTIDAVLENMVQQRASDLHLTMQEPICLRIDGEIVRISNERITEEAMQNYLLPIMPPRNRQEFIDSSDTDFAYEIPGLARFRVNIFRDRSGVGAVLRQIPERVMTADELALAPAIRKLCELSKGLVIVTGPTGSGKSTTLAAMIDLINETRSEHILTIEDPIEFVHKQKRCLINQREVHKHTGSFSRALRAALREDPDIILIGELRDLETVKIAIETAETGHLVFGTLHTNTAISTIDRLIDQFAADQQEQVRVMLADSLRGVVAQTLIKKKGGGRVAAQEILIVDKAVSSLIREGNTHMVQNHMQTQKTKGNLQLNEALMNLVNKGLIEPKDAYTKSLEKDALLIMLQQKGIKLEILKSAS